MYFGMLVSRSRTLTCLCISGCLLGDEGMEQITNVLREARCLHTLECKDNFLSEAFGAERLLPAVRGCAPLRQLEADAFAPEVREAQELLRLRG